MNSATFAEIAAHGRRMQTIPQPTFADAVLAMATAEVSDTPANRRVIDHTVPTIWMALRDITPHLDDEETSKWWAELKRWVYRQKCGQPRRFDERDVDFDARIAEALAFLTGERP